MTFTAPHKPNITLGRELASIIHDAGVWTPRAKQVAIGPSEMGHECTRRLAYKLLDWEQVNVSQSSNWASQVGSAIHSHLADIFRKKEGYEVEQKVTIRGQLAGTVDLFDTVRGIVIDWKTTGHSKLQEYRKSGATQQHITQVQLYGYGKALTGAKVHKVALAYLPTSGTLDDLHLDLHDYDESLALAALARVDDIHALMAQLNIEDNPSMWDVIPKVANRNCNWCPYFLPYSKESAKGCAGDTNG
jgi:hypothetical protein